MIVHMDAHSPDSHSHLTSRFAGELRAEVARRKTPRSEIAEAAGLSLDQFNRRYRGDQDCTLTEASRIAEALGVPFSILLMRAIGDERAA